MNKTLIQKIKNFPDSPGVYSMKDATGKIIYIGKAVSLRERVRSYFYQTSPKAKRVTPRSPTCPSKLQRSGKGEVGWNPNLSIKTIRQMEQVGDIEYIETDSEIEALLLESKLVKKYSPKYNIDLKDDKSRAYVHFSRENYSRISILRETELHELKEKNPLIYGPFQSAGQVRQALEQIRKIIPFRSCKVLPKKRCLYGYLGLCEMPCEDKISETDYRKRIRQVRDFFEGKKSRVLSSLKKEMKLAAKNHAFEEAAKTRDRIFAIEHLRQMFAIKETINETVFRRIEGYDISNISGLYATGSMVVFLNGESEKSEYRKFKIKSVVGVNDVAMIKEVLRRRFINDWDKPDLILIDGGRGQVSAAVAVLKGLNLNIPIVGLAKGPDRKKDELITSQILPRNEIKVFKQIRDEAHRFAKNYYSKLHRKIFRSHK